MPECCRCRGELIASTACLSIAPTGDGQGEPAVAQPVAVVGDGEPAGLLGQRFLALQGLELVVFGDLGGDHFEDPVCEPAQRDRVVLLGQADQVGLGVAAVLDRQRVDALDDHHGLFFGDLPGGHRVPDRFVVVVQGVGEVQASLRVPFGLPGRVGPVAARVRGAGLSAEVETFGLAGDAELELGDSAPQRTQGGQGVGQLRSGQGPAADLGEVVELGVDPGDSGRDRVRLWFTEYRCHTGNSGIRHRHSRSGNAGISGTGGEVFRELLERRCQWSRQARPAGADHRVKPWSRHSLAGARCSTTGVTPWSRHSSLALAARPPEVTPGV